MASAASSSSPSPLKFILLLTTILSVTIFFLLSPPNHQSKPNTSRLLLQSQSSQSHCSSILSLASGGGGGGGILDYSSLHLCLLSLPNRGGGKTKPFLSLSLLGLLLLLHFYALVKTARDHFSPVVTALSAHLLLSPSMAAVTLLALGNGAPDVFASVVALRHGQPRTGLAAILSAGAFVSAFVVGSVAVLAAPFPLDPAPFVRDVFFYLLAASGLFYVYLSAEIFLWQAIGFIAFYIFFVGLVFWMDLGVGSRTTSSRRRDEEEQEVEMGFVEKEKDIGALKISSSSSSSSSSWGAVGHRDDGKEAVESSWSFFWVLGKISWLWEVPVTIVLKLTVPSISPSEWSRFYAAANICLCPLAVLYSFNSFIAMDSQIVFFLPHRHFPLWFVVLFVSLCLAVAHFILEKEPPQTDGEQIATTLVAFVMSVFWISTMAGELLNCLAAVGTIMDLPPAILGLTVLAWGNSVGDLVADVSLAKAGQPAMAMAGCFAGPMFNMLVGLGMAMVIETAKVYPEAYELRFNVGIVVAFVFLLLSLMGSLLVVTWFRFRVPRFWGFCLVGLYLLFTAVSLSIAKFSG